MTNRGAWSSTSRDGFADSGALDSTTEGLLRATLNAGRVRIPTGLLGLIAETSVPRGATEVSTFTALYPVGTTVESDTPLFRWQPQAGASGYVVTVYDSRFDVVASSPVVVLPEWRPSQPLERGGLYSWLVRIPKAGLESETAGSLAPEARFKVLDVDKAAELECPPATHTPLSSAPGHSLRAGRAVRRGGRGVAAAHAAQSRLAPGRGSPRELEDRARWRRKGRPRVARAPRPSGHSPDNGRFRSNRSRIRTGSDVHPHPPEHRISLRGPPRAAVIIA